MVLKKENFLIKRISYKWNIFSWPRNNYTRMALWITSYWTWEEWVLKKLWSQKLLYDKFITSLLKASKTQVKFIPKIKFSNTTLRKIKILFVEVIFRWSLKTFERIPNRRDQDYFYSYKNDEFKQILWYRQLFNFISRCLYFMTGPKFVVPILGIV